MIETPRTHEHAFINALRALAAFWVLAYHCMQWGGWSRWALLPSAKLAVDLFMMISGFLMAANASVRRDREPLNQRSSWVRFWVRRFFRIAPAYYVALALTLIFGEYLTAGSRAVQSLRPEDWAAIHYDPTARDSSIASVLMHVSFLFGLHPGYASSVGLPDWSLSLEMQFYFIFPFLFLAMERAGFRRVGLTAGVCSMLLGSAIASRIYFPEPSLLFFKFQYFIAGILIFRALRAEEDEVERIALAAVAVLLVSGAPGYYGSQVVWLPLLAVAMLALGWMETRGITPPAISRVVRSRVVRFASDTSYSVYLFHLMFVSIGGLILQSHRELFLPWRSSARAGLLLLFVAACSYPLGYVIHRFVELPGIELGKRLLSRKTMSPRKAASVSV